MPTGPHCIERAVDTCAPRHGGFVPFANPGDDGLHADVFWRPEDFARVVRAYVRPVSDAGFGSVLALGNLAPRRTLLKAVDGTQHILLRDRRHVVQVFCRGSDIRTDPFAIELIVDRFPAIETRIELLRAMAKLYSRKRIGGGIGGWTVEATRHGDALATFDLRQAGWGFQNIARFIHGDRFVDHEWSDPNRTLKNKVWRSYRRAERMVAGGYRTLLR